MSEGLTEMDCVAISGAHEDPEGFVGPCGMCRLVVVTRKGICFLGPRYKVFPLKVLFMIAIVSDKPWPSSTLIFRFTLFDLMGWWRLQTWMFNFQKLFHRKTSNSNFTTETVSRLVFCNIFWKLNWSCSYTVLKYYIKEVKVFIRTLFCILSYYIK